MDSAQHHCAAGILSGPEHLETDRLQRFANDANVIQRIDQRADAGFVVLVANQQRDALLGLRGRWHQRQQEQDNGGPHHLSIPREPAGTIGGNASVAKLPEPREGAGAHEGVAENEGVRRRMPIAVTSRLEMGFPQAPFASRTVSGASSIFTKPSGRARCKRIASFYQMGPLSCHH